MPTIISGLDPKARMDAYLAGERTQHELMARGQQAKEQAAARKERLLKTYIEAATKAKTEQAKALADANARAQMGDVQAMQQQNMEAQAARQPPQQKRLGEMAGVLSRITDPKARALAAEEFSSYEKGLREEEERQAAASIIETAGADGIIDPEVFEQRRAAGEDPRALAKEAGEARMKQAAASVAMNESANAAAKAQMLIDSAEEGSPVRQRMELALAAFQNSKTAQETPGMGRKMLAQIQKLIQNETFKEGVEKQSENSLPNMIPSALGAQRAPGARAAQQSLPRGKAEVLAMGGPPQGGAAPQVSDEAFLAQIQALRAQGVKITPSVIAQLKAQGASPAAR